MATSQFTIYRHTDTSAPTVNGTAGSLITLLQACLVTGYGSKSGAGWTAQGWNTSTQAAWKMGTVGSGSSGGILYVNDNAPGSHGGREARITGFETMTTAYTGTGQFPTVAQGGVLFARKSSVADTSLRPWIVVADAVTVYVFINTYDSGAYYTFTFGDIYSVGGASDTYRCKISGRNAEGYISSNYNSLDTYSAMNTATGTYSSATAAHYLDRSYTGTGTAVTASQHADALSMSSTVSANNFNFGTAAGLQLPNGPDNSIYFCPIWVCESVANCIRGYYRGLWVPCHVYGCLSEGQVITGTGAFSGRTFLALNRIDTSSTIVIETSATVATN